MSTIPDVRGMRLAHACAVLLPLRLGIICKSVPGVLGEVYDQGQAPDGHIKLQVGNGEPR